MGCVNVDRIRGHAIIQAVTHRPLTAEARRGLRPVLLRFIVDKVALAQVFLRVLWFYFVILSSTLLTLTDIPFK